MRHRQLPTDLQERVRRFVQYKWLATRGVDEESILRSLPLDIRREIQRHLCLDLLRRVSWYIISTISLFPINETGICESMIFYGLLKLSVVKLRFNYGKMENLTLPPFCRSHFFRKWMISF